MKPKSDKEKKPVSPAKGGAKDKPAKAPAKDELDDDDDIDDDEEDDDKPAKKISKSTKSKKKKDDDDDEDEDDAADDIDDEWEKPAEDDDFDPDFAEFDLPKSKTKKSGGSKKKGDDDLEIDEDFKELGLFNDNPGLDEEDDDF